jgi:hypothetical protein
MYMHGLRSWACGSLGSVAPGEIGAVEQSEVPEEYREHVGRYFEP